jgi:hypothetical protein
MKKSLQRGLTGMVLAALGLVGVAQGAVTNTVPWSDSFETYASGTAIVGSNGWSSQSSTAGVVTNDIIRANLLTNYPVGSKTYPLPEPPTTHTNILQVNSVLANAVESTTGGVVLVDFLLQPTYSDSDPIGQTNDQCAFYITTNGLVTIWTQDRVLATNKWLTLTNSPVLGTSEWARITVVQDYSNQMYQIRVNERALVDDKGFSYAGTNAVGPWFYMVQTNGVLATLVAEAGPAYMEDLVTAKRTLTWSKGAFAESVTNNGQIDNAAPLVITLSNDTFNAVVGEDLVGSGKLVVTNLPPGLSAVATVTNGTTVSVTLTNRAAVHEAVNSIQNLGLTFADTAFSMRCGWDVTGYSQTNLAVSFTNTPSLGYSGVSFTERSANDGQIDNTSPVVITLANATFTGTLNEDFATNSLKLLVVGLPSTLTGQVLRVNSTQLEVRVLGTAIPNNSANNISAMQLQFQAGAFSMGTVPLTSVLNLSTNFSISFIDASTLSYGSMIFTETVTNNGTLNGTTLTLVNKSFNALQGVDMVGSGQITVSHLPAGLGLTIVRGVTAQTATLIFTGAATQHEAVNSIANLGITLTDGAVVGGNAAGVSNYALGNFTIQYANARTLSYSGTNFNEVAAGVIDNRTPITITLSGDTFSGVNGDDFVAAGKILVTHLPPGLSAVVTRDLSTRLSVRLTGTATSHASTDSITNLTFTFQSGAISGGSEAYVVNTQKTNLSVTFNDLTGSFNYVPFEESFEEYRLGTQITGSNGWTADYLSDAATVTNTAAVLALLPDYVAALARSYPITGTHTQVLYVADYLHNDIHSETLTNVFVDFLTIPVAVADQAESSTNDQFACYVTTNNHLVVWHRNVTTVTNEWITLSNAPSIGTSAWVRLTVESDYGHNMYQVRVNEGSPVSDPRGWTGYGGSPTGTWFYMVKTNGTMTTFRISGGGGGYLDDFTVREALPEMFAKVLSGSIYIMR